MNDLYPMLPDKFTDAANRSHVNTPAAIHGVNRQPAFSSTIKHLRVGIATVAESSNPDMHA
jgi:hypothetical protein